MHNAHPTSKDFDSLLFWSNSIIRMNKIVKLQNIFYYFFSSIYINILSHMTASKSQTPRHIEHLRFSWDASACVHYINSYINGLRETDSKASHDPIQAPIKFAFESIHHRNS